MAQPRFVQRLSEIGVSLDAILLDPNNPRLIGLDGFEGVEERRIAEKSVQENALNKLNSYRAFDQESLRASIEKSGLLGVDRIVIRPIPEKDASGNPLFVVVEGNRRIAACKTLLLQHKSGEKTLADDILESLSNPRVLLLSEDEAEEARLDQWVIQGIRHISGIRPWGAYQAARTIEAMLSKLGYAESDVASALSISIQRVRRSMRVLSALQQMRESDDYSEYAGPEMYAYFDEALKRPAIRRWLGWSEDEKVFEEDERLQHFYITRAGKWCDS
jgi:hypothetical protein